VTDRGIVITIRIGEKGERSIGRVCVPAVVIYQRVGSNGGVLITGAIEQKCCRAHCRIEVSVVEASAPLRTPVLKLASVFEKSEYQPTAVFPAPAVRKLSALHPSAVV
jgi:hypothetical protein